MATLGRRRENKKGRVNTVRLKFAKWFGSTLVVGVLMTTPNFINNNGGYDAMAEKQKSKTELTKEQEQKLEKLGKECADLFFKFIKTGDAKYYDEFDKARKTKFNDKNASTYLAFKKPFKDVLKTQAKYDPGLKGYLNAYDAANEKFSVRDFFKATNDLMFDVKTLGDAEKKYGKAIVYSFTNLVTWRLATYAAELSIEAFDPIKSENATKKMDRIAEMEILGVPLMDFDMFVITYDKQVAKKFAEKEGMVELWDAYEANVGGDATMRGLVTDVHDCAELISKGKKKAEKQYGKEFVAMVVTFIGLTPVKTEEPKEVKEYSNEELITLFDEGKISELISYPFPTYPSIGSKPICDSTKEGKKKKKSERIKFMQLLYNKILFKDKEFQKFLPKFSIFKGLKGKKVKVNGRREKFVIYIKAINYFLNEKAQDQEFKGMLVDAGIYPGQLKKNHQVTETTLKALAAYFGIFEKFEPVPLEEQIGNLSATDKEFYEENLAPWLEEKQKYTILNLHGMIDYLFNEVRNGKKINKLDPKLHHFQTSDYMIQTMFLNMKPSEISNAILSGEGIADALNTILGEGAITNHTNPATQGARILSVELLLDNFVQNIDEYFPEDFITSTIDSIKEKNPKSKEIEPLTSIKKKTPIPINGKFEGHEMGTVKAIQTLLFEYSREDADYNAILKELGINYADLKATGKFDENTATAFAAYISYKKETWEDEKEGMLAEKVPEGTTTETKPGKKKPKGKKPEPGEGVILFR